MFTKIKAKTERCKVIYNIVNQIFMLTLKPATVVSPVRLVGSYGAPYYERNAGLCEGVYGCVLLSFILASSVAG